MVSREERYSKTGKKMNKLVPTYFLENRPSLKSTDQVLLRSVCVFQRKKYFIYKFEENGLFHVLKYITARRKFDKKGTKLGSFDFTSRRPYAILYPISHTGMYLLSDSHTNPCNFNTNFSQTCAMLSKPQNSFACWKLIRKVRKISLQLPQVLY